MMKKLLTSVVLLGCLLVSVYAQGGKEVVQEKPTQVERKGAQASSKAPEANFTGDVLVTPFFSDNEDAPYYGSYVTFAPGARTNWHNHPAGQRLIVTEGVCWTQEEGGEKIIAYPGDAVWCPAGVKHWHGASPDTTMTHLAIGGRVPGKSVQWFEQVSDEQYLSGTVSQESAAVSALPARQQSIVAIASLAAFGDIERLKAALGEGLDAGLSVNEIKEVLIQLYAYAGFPRSLNAINAFNDVIKTREGSGITDTIGAEPTVLPRTADKYAAGRTNLERLSGVTNAPPAGYAVFVPTIEVFLKEHLFADIFARGVLTWQDRELTTISVLSAIPGVNAQLQSHMGLAMYNGLDEAQMRAFIAVLAEKAGQPTANNAKTVLERVLAARK
ncbi:MAG: carboxymuconolactone decarboxylase family protein [Treponema sp.]|nr:carboxymuconolactone decarboxylase family protein [Treponema sp.]